MIPFEPSKIPMPFAYEGGRNEILESGGEVSGEASYSQGFPAITSTPLSQGGIPPRRKDFNGILYILSAYAYLYQSGGTPSYSSEVDYIAGCIVYYSNQFYVCVKQNGSGTTNGLKTPGSDSSYWKTLWDYLMGDVSNAGSGTNPIYLSNGKFVASTSTVGSSTRPVYLNSGTITQTGKTLDVSVTGSAESLGSQTVGSATKGIYLNSGVPTAMSGTVGSGTNPVYLSNGTITKSGSTVGSGTKPVYLSSGTVTASGSTVGSGTKPIYMSGGTLTASGSTVGDENTPVYLKGGVLTACSGGMGVSDYSLGASGYVRFSMGLIIQWGTKNTTGSATSSGVYTVKFPISFTSASSYVIMKNAAWSAGGSKAYDNEISAFNKTASTAQMRVAGGDSNEEWLAVGY